MGAPEPALLILDCDGVLVDSEAIAERNFRAEFAEMGLPLPDDYARRFRGATMPEMLGVIEAELGRSLPPDFEDRLRARDLAAYETELGPVPGAREFVEGLRLPFCVASSGSFAKMRRTLGTCGLLDLFEGRLFSAERVGRGKPAPDLFLMADGEMGAEPARCLVIEDSVNGIGAARAAGMTVWGFVGGSHGDAALAAELAHAGAERVLGGWADWPDAASWNGA